MEIIKTTLKGGCVYVLFNGSEYFFHDETAGVIAHAKRNDYCDYLFSLRVGNSRLAGTFLTNSVIAEHAMKVISKVEGERLSKRVTFDVEDADFRDSDISLRLV